MSSKSKRPVCIRCPDAASADLYKHGNDLRACQEKDRKDGVRPAVSEYWRDYKDDPSADVSSFNTDANLCQQYLVHAQQMNDEDKPTATFAGIDLTKQLLEHAACIAFPPRSKDQIALDRKNAKYGKKSVNKSTPAPKQMPPTPTTDDLPEVSAELITSAVPAGPDPTPASTSSTMARRHNAAVPVDGDNSLAAMFQGVSLSSSTSGAGSSKLAAPGMKPKLQASDELLCLRCPTPEAACDKEHGSDLQQCMQAYRPDLCHPNELWWGFRDAKDLLDSAEPAELLHSKGDCRLYLNDVRDRSQKAQTQACGNYTSSLERLNDAKMSKQTMELGGTAVTKQILEYAAKQLFGYADMHPGEDLGPAEYGSAAEQPDEDLRSSDLATLGGEVSTQRQDGDQSTATFSPVTSVFMTQAPILGLPGQQEIGKQPAIAQQNAQHDVRPQFPSSHPGADTNRLTPENRYAVRTAFAQDNTSNFEVYTNHFAVSLSSGVQTGVQLREYIVTSESPEWKNATRNKKKVLVRSLIDRHPSLRANISLIASDFTSKIISGTDLLGGQPSAAVQVPSYRAGTRDEPVSVDMVLTHNRTFGLDGLQQYVSGQNIAYEERGAAEAINIIVAKAISDGSPTTFSGGNNKFYFRPGWHDLGPRNTPHDSGLIAVRGYSCSIRPAMGTVTLNINTVTGTFYRPATVDQYLSRYRAHGFPDVSMAVRQQSPAHIRNLQLANAHLAGLRVYVLFPRSGAYPDSPEIDGHVRRTKTVRDVASYASQVQFERSASERGSSDFVSVEDHIRDTYRALVDSNDLDMNGQQLAVNVGSKAPNQKFYMSKHLKVLGDQIYRRKLPADLVAGMIDVARRRPEENRQAILGEGIASLGLHNSTAPIFAALGVRISPNMMSVPARRVNIPRIRYAPMAANKVTQAQREGISDRLQPNKSSWLTKHQTFLGNQKRFNARGNAMVQVICVNATPMEAPYQNFRTGFAQQLVNCVSANGLQRLQLRMQNGRNHAILSSDNATWDVKALQSRVDGYKKAGVHLVVLMLPRQDTINAMRYANFKIVCDQLVGITSAVLCEEKMEGSMRGKDKLPVDAVKPMWSYMGNIAMKLNMRLGNTNHGLEVANLHPIIGADQPLDCIVLGADVTHPSGGSNRYTPSIAAVVGSVDSDFGHMPGSMRLQPRRQEQIESLKDMVIECLDRFYTKNQRIPSRILFYRDGVGESYYQTVNIQETRQVTDAWNQFWDSKYGNQPRPVGKPEVTTVIVAKRHHTRFYPKGQGRQTANGNCEAGTVIDSGVTSPYFFDFYLQSHNPLIGSARPTHYFVLENGMKFTPRSLQDLTNNMCYLYGRSTTAVSYVPAAYYADRLCERGRHYLRRFFDDHPDLRNLDEQSINQQIRNDWYRSSGSVSTRDNPWHANLNDTMFWM